MGYDGRIPERRVRSEYIPERRMSAEWEEALRCDDDGGWEQWIDMDTEPYKAAIRSLMDAAGLVPMGIPAPCLYCGAPAEKAEIVHWIPCPICEVCSLISPSRREQLRGW